MPDGDLTETDRLNGWTYDALVKYRAEREAAHPLVGGNVITEYRKPKPAVYLIGSRNFNPHKWG